MTERNHLPPLDTFGLSSFLPKGWTVHICRDDKSGLYRGPDEYTLLKDGIPVAFYATNYARQNKGTECYSDDPIAISIVREVIETATALAKKREAKEIAAGKAKREAERAARLASREAAARKVLLGE